MQLTSERGFKTNILNYEVYRMIMGFCSSKDEIFPLDVEVGICAGREGNCGRTTVVAASFSFFFNIDTSLCREAFSSDLI